MPGLDTRRLLLDALRPPPGQRLDIAVGTTFTLDLAALLAVPLAAALRDGNRAGEESVDGDADGGRSEALDLFETVSRLADRVVVLAQAGMTAVPQRYRPLYACLENSVLPVRRPRPGRIFHPKLWALRFVAESGTVQHRVVVLTRNLTFDRSWDLMLSADQDDSADAAFDTTGLLDALRAAPSLVEGAAGRTAQIVLLEDLTRTLAGARFPLPQHASAGAFLGFGWDATPVTWPFDEQCRDALVVSPFLTAKAADRFLRSATHTATAVARPPAFDEIGDALPAGTRHLVPRPESGPALGEPELDGLPSNSLAGLHAKVYVQDRRGGPYSTWLGSANLTDAGFGGNTEMLVRVDGASWEYGTVGVLGTLTRRDRAPGLIDLLTDYEPGEPEVDGEDEVGGALQQVGIDVASAGATLTVEEMGEETWMVTLTVGAAGPAVELDARLLTLPMTVRVENGMTQWSGIATTSITPYVVLGLSDDTNRHEVLVRAHLEGDPGHRRSAVLASCMASPEDFLRYVLALLGEDDPVSGEIGDLAWDRAALGAWLDPERVLEGLLVAASRTPRRLDQLAALVSELERTERGRAVIPDDFRAVWEPVRAAVAGEQR